MDGGIDAAYSAFFAPHVQAAVQEAINRRPEGYLPVGASLAIHRMSLLAPSARHREMKVRRRPCWRRGRRPRQITSSWTFFTES
jgi:hypothetical protein